MTWSWLDVWGSNPDRCFSNPLCIRFTMSLESNYWTKLGQWESGGQKALTKLHYTPLRVGAQTQGQLYRTTRYIYDCMWKRWVDWIVKGVCKVSEKCNEVSG